MSGTCSPFFATTNCSDRPSFAVHELNLYFRCDNTILYDRLKARNYTEKKLRENVECEIFGTLLEEAQDSYKQELIWELNSDSVEQMEENLEKIVSWALEWKNKQANSMEGL